jgi:hypothetical protein
MFFDKSATKKVLFLNLICNGIQMILTVIFGFWFAVFCQIQSNSDQNNSVTFCITFLLFSFFLKIYN